MILLSSPHMSGLEMDYIKEAFVTNWIAPLGANVTGLEDELECYLGNNVNVAVLSTGTAALHLALVQLGVQYGDEVICQSMTFSASANPIVYLGATPVFVDSESNTWNICPNALETAIQDRISKGILPKAIIAVHLYGMPYNHTAISEISKNYGIPILEDSAESLGSSYKGQKCGTLGDYSILSFNGNKIITTSGGGALVCKEKSQKDKTIFLATQARDNAPHYQHSEIGYNYRLSNICAGIGRGQMKVLDERVIARRDNFDFYSNTFQGIEGISMQTAPDKDYYSNHWLSAMLIDPYSTGFSREDLRLFLLEKKIETRPLWKPLHMQPIFSKYPYYGSDVSEKLFENGLCLPSGSNLTINDKDYIFNSILEFKSCYK